MLLRSLFSPLALYMMNYADSFLVCRPLRFNMCWKILNKERKTHKKIKFKP